MAGPVGCPPHPSKANPSKNFQRFRRIGLVPIDGKKTIGHNVVHLQWGGCDESFRACWHLNSRYNEDYIYDRHQTQ
jgi:hypothetical protein